MQIKIVELRIGMKSIEQKGGGTRKVNKKARDPLITDPLTRKEVEIKLYSLILIQWGVFYNECQK